MAAKLKVGVLGATGYSGLQLTRILERHPRVGKPILLRREGADSGLTNGAKCTAKHRAANQPDDLVEVFPELSGNGGYPLRPLSWPGLKRQGVQLLFLATPHEASRAIVPEAIAQGLRVIDLSGAWRLKQEQHRAIYRFEDADATTAEELTARAVYGLPELNSDCIAAAQLVANPGCYATSVILALTPLLKARLIDLEHGIISDSKSGVSGAGKNPTARTHFVSVADNLSVYSVFEHRHLGEMVEQLGLNDEQLTFTPHLLPIPRGILSTIYLRLNRTMQPAEVEACLRNFYAGRKWVRVFPSSALPQVQFSLQTNYCDLGFCLADDGRRLVMVSCVDNLLKGAAGQAVQNMNWMYDWDEREGLQ
jgi:N-acetyl-gamma-glutamyl-phosphate reductase